MQINCDSWDSGALDSTFSSTISEQQQLNLYEQALFENKILNAHRATYAELSHTLQIRNARKAVLYDLKIRSCHRETQEELNFSSVVKKRSTLK